MKRLASILTGIGLSALSTFPTTVFASTSAHLTPTQTKVIKVDNQTTSSPPALVHQNTTYMPIWYLMQALKKLGISSQWNGTQWTITTPTTMQKPNFGQLQVGSGSSSIYVNGKLVKQVNDVSITDPSSGQATTFMPIWYLTEILNHLGLGAIWNGQSLNLMSASYRTKLRQSIVNYAKKFIGSPYQLGGESHYGIDCSGLVQAAFRHAKIPLPRVAAEQAQVGSVVPKSQLKPGDLVFFDTTGALFSHVGIYVGNNKFVSATTSDGVRISSLSNPYYWGPRFTRATNPIAAL